MLSNIISGNTRRFIGCKVLLYYGPHPVELIQIIYINRGSFVKRMIGIAQIKVDARVQRDRHWVTPIRGFITKYMS